MACYVSGVGAFRAAYYGGLNQGVITACFAFESIFVAIAAYLTIGERLNRYHVTGMMLLVLCVLCIALTDLLKETASAP